MKSHANVFLAVLVALAGRAAGQSVEFRIVQESAVTNSTVVVIPPLIGPSLSSGNSSVNCAVQARVTAGASGTALAGFSFDIVIPGEADANGTLAKLRITALNPPGPDGTYHNGAAATNSAVGAGGIARTYSYLAGIGGAFNGVINTTSGTFTNQSGQQEIGLITGAATGAALLGTPNLDPNGEGSPATWSGYASGNPPVSGDTAALDPALGPVYFAQGQFIDIYRFRYTVSNFSTRLLTLTLANTMAQSFNQFLFNNGSWGPQATTVPATSVIVQGLQVWVGFPAPGTGVPLVLAGTFLLRRRR